MLHPLVAYPLLSAAGRGDARRILPEEAELLPRDIPEKLSLNSLNPTPLSFLPLLEGITQVSSVPV